MGPTEPRGISAVRPARRAREVLSSALGFVQSMDSTSLLLPSAIAELAAASNALYRVESEAVTDEAGVSLVCSAIEQLTRALGNLQEAKLHDNALEIPAQAVARVLAMLYPLSHRASRRRRDVMPEGALSAGDIATLHDAEARGLHTAHAPFSGAERRRHAEPRTVFEVEIGLSSESNFFAGLTSDLSSGGMFVSTNQPAELGREVTLFFVLPSGHSIEATGVVRWRRAAGEASAPGMGVAFTRLNAEDLAAIARFLRPP